MCRLSALLVILAFVSGPGVLAQTSTTVSYDNNYDNANLSLNQVACSTGHHGLETKWHYTTLGSLPTFPNVGGVYTVSGYGSTECGACYAVTYGETGKTINVIAVDRSSTGFTISEAAMNTLTDGQAEALGRVEASYVLVDSSACGLR